MLAGYKTIAFNLIMFVILVYRAKHPDANLPGEAEVNSFLDQIAEHGDALITLLGNIALRFFTKSRVFSKN